MGDDGPVPATGLDGRAGCDCDVVALAASFGGLRALTEILSGWDADFPAAVAIVQHVSPQFVSHMAELLQRHTALPVHDAFEGCRLEPGVAWVAPPGRHMVINGGGAVALTQTPLVHFLRPAADPLFESLAANFPARVIAVILTGSGVDGAAGARAVKAAGGTVIVQDQATSENWGMPRAVLTAGCVDRVLPLPAIGPALLDLLETRRELKRQSRQR